MILDMRKILFVGPDDRRKEFLKGLQKEGVVQIEEYRGDLFSKEGYSVETGTADRIHTALKLLKKYEDDYSHYTDEKIESVTCDDPVECILETHKDMQSLRETEGELLYQRQNLLPWGNFSLKTIRDIEKRAHTVIQFWEVPAKISGTLELPDGTHGVTVATNGQDVFMISLSENRIILENCIEQHIEADLNMIQTQMATVKKDERENVLKILSFLPLREELEEKYLKELNKVQYNQALAEMVEPVDGIFSLQGWASKEDIEKLESTVSGFSAHLMEIKPEPGEKIPTKIKNRGVPALGEGLVSFYDTPAQSDWDPSGWVFLSFVLFFAMIMGDGGYGLTLFLLLLFIRMKTGKKASLSGKRFLSMAMVLTFATFVYGTLFSGFYGINIPIPGLDLLREKFSNPFLDSYISFKGMTDGDAIKNGILMRASVLIGLGHISLSLLLKGFRDFTQKQPIRPFSNFAWIVIMWTFYHVYSASGGNIEQFKMAMTTPPFGYIMGGALGVVFLTSAGTLHPGKLILGGLGGLYNGVQFFSDVLSYIRIFALGLSGSLIAIVFNDLGTQVMGLDIPVVSVILGILILVFGHLLNIGLCLMGAVIHGLRLNFLEYYRWSFDGDGRPFKPFRDLLLQK